MTDPLAWDDEELLTNTHILLRLRILPIPVAVPEPPPAKFVLPEGTDGWQEGRAPVQSEVLPSSLVCQLMHSPLIVCQLNSLLTYEKSVNLRIVRRSRHRAASRGSRARC